MGLVIQVTWGPTSTNLDLQVPNGWEKRLDLKVCPFSNLGLFVLLENLTFSWGKVNLFMKKTVFFAYSFYFYMWIYIYIYLFMNGGYIDSSVVWNSCLWKFSVLCFCSLFGYREIEGKGGSENSEISIFVILNHKLIWKTQVFFIFFGSNIDNPS